MARVLKDHPVLATIVVVGVDGRVVAGATPLGDHPDLSDREYWAALLDTRDYVVGEYAIGRVSGLPVLTVAYPIIDKDGRFLGGLVAGLKLDYLAKLGERAKLPAEAVLTVIDREGVILARYPDSAEWVGRDLNEAGIVKEVSARGEGTAEIVGLDGVKRLYAFHTPLGPSSGIHVTVGIPRSAVYASATDLTATNALGLGLVAILVGLVAWFGADAFVLKPVRGVITAAGRLADGDLSARSGQSTTTGELGHLARTFDEMAETIAERTSGLEESEERFRALVESSPNAIAVHSEGRIVYVNPAGAALVGAESPQELIGRNPVDFVHPDYREAALRRTASVVKDQKVAPLMEEKFLRLDGAELDVEVVAMPFSYGGKPAVTTIIRDISAKKAAEQALREREEELRLGQRMEAIGRLAGGVAHDFNNVLTAIVGHADLLRDGLDPDAPSQEDVAEIRKAADRAAALTRQLLAFSRRQAMQPHVFDLNEVSDSMAGLLQRLIGEDIDLVFRHKPALGPVEADPGQIEQVIMNLVINARDAMPAGGKITIETANVEFDEAYVSTHLSADPGPHVMLAVTDTGTGIAEETLPHIFEPFFTTKEQGKGTGLGLSTVYGIVKQSGGNIWVYSEPGQGTTFKIYLPRTDKAVDWALADRRPRGPAGVGQGNECILVVEDEPAVRSLTARVLRKGGYRVLEAGSSEEGLAAAAEHQGAIDLLLTDLILPGMNGRQLAEKLAQRRQAPAAVLYMSGYTKNAIVHGGRLDEGIDFLEKPFAPEALLRKIREVLDKLGEGRAEMPR
ncbi:MAG: ATP-binding protein [Thermoleophilia bacterium]